MTFEVLHQVGHNSNWSVDSYTNDGCGDGLILSPVHQDQGSIEKLPAEVRNASLFDPQFYLPSSQKTKLKSYAFFPETLVGGFDTTSFLASAKEAAKQCVDFQLSQGFKSVVMPARYLSQMHPDYIERHEAFSLHPFLEAAADIGDTPLCMSLPLTQHMIEDVTFRKRILNWVTKYPEIDQIYLIYVVERETKQIQSAEFLVAAMTFAQEMMATGLNLVIGYQNTESLLFSVFDGIGLTFGTFENTRIFSIDKFLVTEEERRGPKPRIYLPGLLNWVQFEQARAIKRDAKKVWDAIYAPTTFSEEALSRPVDPHFNQPGLYKHHFICMKDQFAELAKFNPKNRATLLSQKIKNAAAHYDELDAQGFLIERHGNGGHLSGWNVAITKIASSLA